MGNLSSYL